VQLPKPPEPAASQPALETAPPPAPVRRIEPIEEAPRMPSAVPPTQPAEKAPALPPSPLPSPSASPAGGAAEPAARPASGAPDAGATPARDAVPAPADTARAPPRLNLDLHPRIGPLNGPSARGLLPLLPAPPERKSKLADDIEKSAKPDCRKAYSGAGLLAVVPLAADAVRDKGCRW
jgi:hypothetical protein